MFPGFTGKAKDIVEALMRGETVDEIALKLHTTPAYIYNIRTDAKNQGLTLGPPPTPNIRAQHEQPLQPPLNIDQKPVVTVPPAAMTGHPTPNLPMRVVREPEVTIHPGQQLPPMAMVPDPRDMLELQQYSQQLQQYFQQLNQQLRVPQQPAPSPNRNFEKAFCTVVEGITVVNILKALGLFPK